MMTEVVVGMVMRFMRGVDVVFVDVVVVVDDVGDDIWISF